MFDIGFFEILVIAIVALVVIGPERMPETVRNVGLWIGRLKRSLRETRSEIERQIGADDIRRQLHNEDVMRSLEKTRQQFEGAVEEGTRPILKTKPDQQAEKLPDDAAEPKLSTTSATAPEPSRTDSPQSNIGEASAPAAEPDQDKSSSSKT